MKLVILTSETPANVWLVNRILARHEVAGMVIERRPLALTRREKIDRRWRLIRRHGVARTVNKLLYNRVRWRWLEPAADVAVRATLFPGGAPVAYARQVPTVVVGSVNDAAAAAFIRGVEPDALAVCGTSVILPEIFSLAPRGAINIHTGITPEYRSADPIFWALYHEEPQMVGVTIHYVDRGIDTGPVIHQETLPVHGEDSLATIFVRCIRRGAELYLRALDALADGSVRTLPPRGAAGRSFRSIDLGLVQYLLFRWRFRRLARRLPRRESPSPGGASEAEP